MLNLFFDGRLNTCLEDFSFVKGRVIVPVFLQVGLVSHNFFKYLVEIFLVLLIVIFVRLIFGDSLSNVASRFSMRRFPFVLIWLILHLLKLDQFTTSTLLLTVVALELLVIPKHLVHHVLVVVELGPRLLTLPLF